MFQAKLLSSEDTIFVISFMVQETSKFCTNAQIGDVVTKVRPSKYKGHQ